MTGGNAVKRVSVFVLCYVVFVVSLFVSFFVCLASAGSTG